MMKTWPQQTPFAGRFGEEHKNEWLTPPSIISALGPFDLDPCAPVSPPWPTARRHLSILDNGLLCPWNGRVWLNPPYGPRVGEWLSKMAAHGHGTALIFARTDTAAWQQHVFPAATGVLFLRGRLTFHHVDGSAASNPAGAPSALVAYGAHDWQILRTAGLSGALCPLQEAPCTA
jgi:hypothetical protein